ncbi:MAG TPA: DUF6089 family protein [Saprospiraceae bacterium]|nr:DUF6089 family protein [Saprospiraceae bacterium]
MHKFTLLVCLLSTFQLTAQGNGGNRYFEAGFLFGVTNYSGDMVEKRIELSETHVGYGAYGRYHLGPVFSVKAHVYSGSISGDDANSSSHPQRSLRFSTNIVELGLVGEINFGRRKRFSSTGIHNFSVTPYIFAGIGATFASAEAEYYGPADQLNENLKVPLPEEGLSDKFILMPVGAGIRADISEAFALGVEGGVRPVFSDDLDGVRYNGNPESGDWYYFAGVTASFIITNKKKH